MYNEYNISYNGHTNEEAVRKKNLPWCLGYKYNLNFLNLQKEELLDFDVPNKPISEFSYMSRNRT